MFSYHRQKDNVKLGSVLLSLLPGLISHSVFGEHTWHTWDVNLSWFVNFFFFFNSTLFTFTSQVGESSLQSGNLYSPFMRMCRNLYLGGNQSDHGHTFRGSIGGLVLWDYERSHEDLLKLPFQTDKREPLLATWSDFTRVIIYFKKRTAYILSICRKILFQLRESTYYWTQSEHMQMPWVTFKWGWKRKWI